MVYRVLRFPPQLVGQILCVFWGRKVNSFSGKKGLLLFPFFGAEGTGGGVCGTGGRTGVHPPVYRVFTEFRPTGQKRPSPPPASKKKNGNKKKETKIP